MIVRSALEMRAHRLLADRSEVLEVRLFGSLVKGNAGPGSDADILILLADSDRTFGDRLQAYGKFFTGVDISCDIFPYTRAELVILRSNEHHFIATVWRESQVLASRTR